MGIGILAMDKVKNYDNIDKDAGAWLSPPPILKASCLAAADCTL
jgi:hypothetical protein